MNNQERIIRIQNLLRESLSPLISDDYVLLDIPNHCNIGDNLIWEGELQFLDKYIPHKCLYSANVYNWQEEKIQSAPIILFHGGGNFGDLYRVCQDFRIDLINRYHNKRIIVFPQTVWYENSSLLIKDSIAFNAHPDLFICCRDDLSYREMLKYVDKEKLLLLPDMAFFCDIKQSEIKTGKKLYMFRSDFEINKDLKPSSNNEYEVKDWPTYSYNRASEIIKTFWKERVTELSQILQKTPLSFIVDPVYGLNRKNNRERYIKQGIEFFSKYDQVYTTRLHGLILGVLMGKDVIIVDNKFGKCANFYNTWLKDFEGVEMYVE